MSIHFFQVIQQGLFVRSLRVEVYFVELQLVEDGKPENVVKKNFSRTDTIGIISSIQT